jgi:HK97 gp10 family phage protein
MGKTRYSRTYVEGIDELIKDFDKVSEVAESALDSASKASAEFILSEAKKRVPVKSGKLKNSLAVKSEKNKKSNRKTYRVYNKGVRDGGVKYAFAVEGGTKKMPAKPFLRPAVDENRRRICEIINLEILKVLGKVI